MNGSKHITCFCYPIMLALYQHLNSYVAYPVIPLEYSNNTRGQHQHLPSYTLLILLWSKSDKTSLPKREFSTNIALKFCLVLPLYVESLSMDTICDIIKEI